MTRAGPAKLLGLKDRGQLGIGAAADIAVYREHANFETMFTAPEHVFKDGVRVARAGVITATPTGGVHFVEPAYDRGIEKLLAGYADKHLAVSPRHLVIGRDELCRCGNGGRLLPAACFQTTAN